MKVLFSDATLLHGGAERVISILANKLVDMGIDVEILLLYNREIWYEINEKVVIKNDEEYIGKKNFLEHIKFRKKYFRNSDADIIISFLAPVNMINLIAVKRSKKKIIVADRNDPRRTPTNFIIRFIRNYLYKKADAVVVQSNYNKLYFSKKIQNKSTIIYNPVEMNEYKRLALMTSKEKKIVAVGRLIPQKNHMMLINAFAKVNKFLPDYKLYIYGDGDYKNKLEENVVELGLQNNVFFPGAKKNIFDEIIDAELYVMTSYYEGMPNSLIEAMCLGLPVISTEVSGATDLIKNGENGFLVKINDVEDLAKKMLFILNNEDVALSCAKKATELNEQLQVDLIVNDWLNCINKVLK